MRWNNWLYEGLGTYLQSTEQGIIRQGTFGGGVGRYLKNTNRARISVLGGFAGQTTDYHQNIAPQDLASGLIATNLQFFWFNKTNGDLNALFLPVISQPGRVKFNLNATYYIKLTGKLSLECLFLRQQGQSAASWAFQQRLRLELGTKLEVWKQVTEPAAATQKQVITSVLL